jgi:hypothetical protein
LLNLPLSKCIEAIFALIVFGHLFIKRWLFRRRAGQPFSNAGNRRKRFARRHRRLYAGTISAKDPSMPTPISPSPTKRAASARPPPPSISPRGLAERRKKILLIDLDPQANATSGLGLAKTEGASIYDILLSDKPITDIVQKTADPRLDLVASKWTSPEPKSTWPRATLSPAPDDGPSSRSRRKTPTISS